MNDHRPSAWALSKRLIIVASAIVWGCSPMRDGGEPARKVDVWLNQAIATVQGYEKPWPTSSVDPSGFQRMTVGERPCICTVHFPHEGSYSSWSRKLIISQENGIVYEVVLLPDAKPISFAEALSEAERETKNLSFSDSTLLRGHLDNWRREAPTRSVSTRAIIEERVQLFLEIQQGPGGEGWFVSLSFTYLDERTWEVLRPK
jgi:hypothetical protein